jgi:hypothetical protein
MRKKHSVAAIGTILVAGLATFLPGVIGGQGHGALPAQARTVSNSTTRGVQGASPQDVAFNPTVQHAAAAALPAVNAVGAFFFTYVTGKAVDYVLKATKKIITAGEDAEESSSAADAEEALAFIGAQPKKHKVASLFPTGDSQFNAGG